MERDDSVYIRHILDSILQIENFVGSVGRDEFLKSKLLQNGVVRELEIIGEASKKLSQGFKDKINLRWREIAGMRDKLIHDYFSVDVESVWETVIRDIPELKRKLVSAKGADGD